MVEEDLGTEASKSLARELVVYHRRPGGQSQLSAMLDLEPETDRIKRALLYAREHLSESLSVEFGRGFLHQHPAIQPVSLSETQFGWQVRSNRVMLLPYERCLQLDLVGAGRIVPIASVLGS